MSGLYQQYSASHDTAVLNKMLVKYANNLANSCINMPAFRAAQSAKSGSGTKTYFDLGRQGVSAKTILAKLKKGASIENILATYIPKSPQFKKLLSFYKPGDTSEQMRKIRLNIERTKLMPQAGWGNYIELNVPEYMLHFYEGGSVSMQFPVIVGKPSWQTPIFSSTMKYIVLNPTWTLTENIIREDLIRKVKKNPGYFKRHNMKIYADFKENAPELNPKKINWKKYEGKDNKTPIPFRIVQGSSKKNALGTVKFMFPNRFSVYMHDTQAKSLFKRKARAFSHGCMRLSKPNELLGKVATSYAQTSMEIINKHKSNSKISYVKLKRHIPVHIVYQTAYVGSGGLQFYPDVYGFDKSQRIRD
jgi:murein L,D-transpeptidase YcbB/YkuD